MSNFTDDRIEGENCIVGVKFFVFQKCMFH